MGESAHRRAIEKFSRAVGAKKLKVYDSVLSLAGFARHAGVDSACESAVIAGTQKPHADRLLHLAFSRAFGNFRP